jgi:hypothetical protein
MLGQGVVNRDAAHPVIELVSARQRVDAGNATVADLQVFFAEQDPTLWNDAFATVSDQAKVAIRKTLDESMASAANVKSIINLRPFVRIPDVLASYKLMKSLNPEIVIPGHGAVSTTKIFDEYEGFYTLLLKRVGEMAAQGKSLDDIQKELKMPEYADWAGQNNLPQNIQVAYESLKK